MIISTICGCAIESRCKNCQYRNPPTCNQIKPIRGSRANDRLYRYMSPVLTDEQRTNQRFSGGYCVPRLELPLLNMCRFLMSASFCRSRIHLSAVFCVLFMGLSPGLSASTRLNNDVIHMKNGDIITCYTSSEMSSLLSRSVRCQKFYLHNRKGWSGMEKSWLANCRDIESRRHQRQRLEPHSHRLTLT